jgi:RNA polymerase sigma-70 factor (ECF subfamily)
LGRDGLAWGAFAFGDAVFSDKITLLANGTPELKTSARSMEQPQSHKDGRKAQLLVLSTSASLLDGLWAQNRDAWHSFVSLYAPLVIRWCQRHGLSEADVPDVAQEVFTRVSQALPRFRKETPAHSFRGWLCRITHDQIADFFRKRDSALQVQGGSQVLSWLHQLPDRSFPEPAGEEASREERFLFQQAVRTIRSEFSDHHWQIFWRVTVDGNPAADVAAEFGATPAAVRQVKSRVLRRLREAVGEVPD